MRFGLLAAFALGCTSDGSGARAGDPTEQPPSVPEDGGGDPDAGKGPGGSHPDSGSSDAQPADSGAGSIPDADDDAGAAGPQDEGKRCRKDADCDDGKYCNGVEDCDPYSKDADHRGCLPGLAIVCDDDIGCTVDACDEEADACAFEIEHSLCDDGKFCNGAEVCNPTDANADDDGCVDDTRDVCDDGFDCSLDACVEALGCINTPKNALCADDSFCNGDEVCDPEDPAADEDGCIGGSDPCDDGDPCTLDTCTESNDSCTNDPDAGVPDDAGMCG